MPVIIKYGRVVKYRKEVPPVKLHGPLITRSYGYDFLL